MTVTMLKKLQNILQSEVCDKIELRESADTGTEYRVVNPTCFLGFKPPDMPVLDLVDSQNSIPCMIVGIKKWTDNGQDGEREIELFFAVDSPGVLNEDKKFTPSFEGYIDLLNFMDTTTAFLLKDSFTFDFMTISSDIEGGLCEEQAYPLWFGYLRFKVKYSAYPNTDMAKYL